MLLTELGVNVDSHGKMPDVVLDCPKRNWLFLIESVTSHGPVDGKRRADLARQLAGSKAGLVYVTGFPNRSTMGPLFIRNRVGNRGLGRGCAVTFDPFQRRALPWPLML